MLKYEQVVSAAKPLGEMLAKAITKLPPSQGSMTLVPVPLHSSKRRHRGFNQAELIARAALREIKVEGAKVAAGILERRRETASQIGLTRPQRIENIRGAFRVAHASRIRGQRLILVDDVLTTGTTASECARVLLNAGAERVWVATVARTLKNADAGHAIEPEFATALQAS